MLEILKSCLDLVIGLGSSVLSAINSVALWGWEVLYALHIYHPRIEGLLIGIALAWVMLRRDKHPLLRVLSAPLKLIVDILDLAWDQVIEIAGDIWGTAYGWVFGALGWTKTKLTGAYRYVLDGLTKIKDRLSKKAE